MKQLKNSLGWSEWQIVACFLSILISLAVFSKINAYKACAIVDAQQIVTEEPAQVTIEGAVSKPGVYAVKVGSSVGQAIKKAHPKPNANLKKINVGEPIKGPVRIEIEELKEITVHIDGAVESRQTLLLPIGTKICDLKSKIHFTDEADLDLLKAILKKRRKLKDGEIIFVPKISVE